jgi:hypothetical protein
MFVNIDNAANYLLLHELMKTESIVYNDFKVIDVSKRNRNLKVMRKNGLSYLLKQPNPNRYDRAKIRKEARIYTLAWKNSKFKSFSRILPHMLKFDARLNILITELITNGIQLDKYVYDTSTLEFPNNLALLLGKAIAIYHKTFSRPEHANMVLFLPRGFPSFFYLCHPGPRVFSRLSLANLQLLKVIQKQSDFLKLFNSLESTWRIETVIHGDIRWDNIMILHSPNNESTKIKLIDWEFARLGDPAWDIGSVFHDFITFWLYSLHVRRKEQNPLQRIQSNIRAFWQSYSRACRINDAEYNDFLFRSTRYCAIRLLQRVYESSFDEAELSEISLQTVQLSANIISNIGMAITYLLGIPLRGNHL